MSRQSNFWTNFQPSNIWVLAVLIFNPNNVIHLNFQQIRKSAKYSGSPYRIISHKECVFNDDLKIVVCSGMKVEFGLSPCCLKVILLMKQYFINSVQSSLKSHFLWVALYFIPFYSGLKISKYFVSNLSQATAEPKLKTGCRYETLYGNWVSSRMCDSWTENAVLRRMFLGLIWDL